MSKKNGILHVGDDHPDGAAFAAREIAGVEIGVVFQFLDCLDHPGACGSLDDACIVEYPRDRCGGDLGAAGHLFEVHVFNIVQEIVGFAGFGAWGVGFGESVYMVTDSRSGSLTQRRRNQTRGLLQRGDAESAEKKSPSCARIDRLKPAPPRRGNYRCERRQAGRPVLRDLPVDGIAFVEDGVEGG